MFYKFFPGTKEKVLLFISLCYLLLYNTPFIWDKDFSVKGFLIFFLENKHFPEITQKFILSLGKASVM